MLHIQAIVKSVCWLIIGILFGLAGVILVLASAKFYSVSPDWEQVDENIVIFMCIALMGGAGSDFLLSKIHTFWCRLCLFIFAVLSFFIAFYIYNPNVKYKPAHDIMYNFEIGYIVVTCIYCMVLKSIIFFHEALSHKKLKF